jgi:hypothetical protein
LHGWSLDDDCRVGSCLDEGYLDPNPGFCGGDAAKWGCVIVNASRNRCGDVSQEWSSEIEESEIDLAKMSIVDVCSRGNDYPRIQSVGESEIEIECEIEESRSRSGDVSMSVSVSMSVIDEMDHRGTLLRFCPPSRVDKHRLEEIAASSSYPFAWTSLGRTAGDRNHRCFVTGCGYQGWLVVRRNLQGSGHGHVNGRVNAKVNGKGSARANVSEGGHAHIDRGQGERSDPRRGETCLDRTCPGHAHLFQAHREKASGFGTGHRSHGSRKIDLHHGGSYRVPESLDGFYL